MSVNKHLVQHPNQDNNIFHTSQKESDYSICVVHSTNQHLLECKVSTHYTTLVSFIKHNNSHLKYNSYKIGVDTVGIF